jgi:hypothetical protein
MDGTDADVKLVFTADAVDGNFLYSLKFQPISTSGSTTTSAAAARIYLNNGSTVGTGTNNVLLYEFTLPATAVNVTGTTGVVGVLIPMNMQIQAGYAVYVGITAMAANTQWNIIAETGEYN